MTTPRHHPDDIAAVMAVRRPFLLALADGIAITIKRENIDLSRTPSTRKPVRT